ncbi:MAG: hypothetical protein C0483_04945 [Pirellula sp.]|nr:hypothetical protein [Pirellula sp.]
MPPRQVNGIVRRQTISVLSHSTLRNRYYALCKRLGAPRTASVYHTVGTGFGDPHVEINSAGYHYVVTERGQEYRRRTTTDAEELLYWLISDVVFDMASKYELQHRVPKQDGRRLMFQKRIELISTLSPEWAERKRAEIEAILAEHPYSDD